MERFNEWMKESYGYTWDEHKANLFREGYDVKDIMDEFLGLTFVWCKLDKDVQEGV